MKRKWKVFLAVLLVMFVANVNAEILFSDSFNRADSLDIDAGAPTGMGGTLGTMTYVETDEDLYIEINGDTPENQVTATTLTNITSNELHLAEGPNMGLLYMDHNFTDSQILTDGGMKIGLTIINGGNFSDNERFVGFGVGNTLAEAQAAKFDFNYDGFRGRIGNWNGFSDLWVGWSPNNGGKIQVYKNGPTSQGGENYAIEGTPLTGNDRLELELFFDSFDDGSPVSAKILWNGTVVGTESFAWDADGVAENYIGINARQGNWMIVDDLSIETVPEPATLLLLGLGTLVLRKRK